ncbi:nitroreductase family protein [Paenibacillus hamazuiensis]|uniref:nitroreductase family protein n=1 Tax=Paenibacillus hamazuiensis TaxID=2936508 RepID=UPI00200E11F5|nr:nitroreductase family protein [Paenibacillus hamazuiensis]
MTVLVEQAVQQAVRHVMKARSSVKRYEIGRTIPENVLHEIIELAGTAPSSWNLQHWTFIVVQDQSRKERILPVANNQRQVVECSALVVVLADLEANRNAGEIYEEAVKQGLMTEEIKEILIKQIEQAYANVPNIGLIEAYKNSSLAAMQLMLAAKAAGIDSCPMGGFNPQGLRELLRIPERYAPSLLISLGYGAKEAHPSSRFPLDKVMVKESF